MIISRAENYTPERKIQLIQEIKEAPRLAPLLQKIGGESNIFFSGCVPKKEVTRGWKEAVKIKAENVFRLRQKMYNFLFEQTRKPAQLSALRELGHYGEIVSSNAKRFVEQVTTLTQLIQSKDHKSASALVLELNLLKDQVEDDMPFCKDEELKKKYTESNTAYFELLENAEDRKLVLQEIIYDFEDNKIDMGVERLRHLHMTALFLHDLSEESSEHRAMYLEFVKNNKLEAQITKN